MSDSAQSTSRTAPDSRSSSITLSEGTASQSPDATLKTDLGEETPACASDVCFFCCEKVYAMERGSAEGLFFHRRCFACQLCGGVLRIAAYRFSAAEGTFSCPQQCNTSCVGLSDQRTPRMSSSSTCSRISADEECRRLSVFSVSTVTRERIELENDEVEAESPTCRWTSDGEFSSDSDTLDIAQEEEEELLCHLCPIEDEDEESSDGVSDVTPPESPVLATPSTASFVTKVDSTSSLCSFPPLEKEVFLTGTATVAESRPMDSVSLEKLLPLPVTPTEGSGLGHLRGPGPNVTSPPSLKAAFWKAVVGRKAKVRQEHPNAVQSSPQDVCALGTANVKSGFDRMNENKPEAAQLAYIPHALAFKPTFPVKFLRKRFPRPAPQAECDGRSSCTTEVVGVLVRPEEPSGLSVPESLFQSLPTGQQEDPAGRRRTHESRQRRAKRRQLKRLRQAQMIQRELEMVEEEQQCLEAAGVTLEKHLRGDHQGADLDEKSRLMRLWFRLVQRRNILLRYESELAIRARDLQLEDRQSGLQRELRENMTLEDHLKDETELGKERRLLEEMLDVMEQRKALLPLLEELRKTAEGPDQGAASHYKP
ncbi:uncharacterized protein LOC144180960 [Stigmatopora nigra]